MPLFLPSLLAWRVWSRSLRCFCRQQGEGWPYRPWAAGSLCARLLLSTRLIQLAPRVFWRAAELLAWVCAGAGGPWALLLLAPAGLRDDR